MNTFLQTICYTMMIAATVALSSTGCAAQGTATQIRPASNSTQTSSPISTNVLDPSRATLRADPVFLALVKTTKGDFTIEVHRDWAPNGADRFYNMIKAGYFDSDIAIYRAIEGFMFQFGIHGDPEVNAKWGDATIMDDPAVGISNAPGTISFAQTQNANSRSVQMFVNLGMNSMLDKPQAAGGKPFVPFGEVVRGLEVLQKINTEYGENRRGENIQGNFKAKGNDFILERFKRIDLIKSVTIVEN